MSTLAEQQRSRSGSSALPVPSSGRQPEVPQGSQNEVRIAACCSGWLVHIIEGECMSELEFSIEDHEKAYAAGQRIRLGLHRG